MYTPSDGFNWQVAKALHLTTGVFHGQFHEHLLQTHLKMEPICVILNRQISDHHPLHEILKYHCRGMLPLNANAGPSFFGESGSANIMFGFGSPGAIKLVQRGFKKMIWNDIDLENNLKVCCSEKAMLDLWQESLVRVVMADRQRVTTQGQGTNFGCKKVGIVHVEAFSSFKITF